MLNNDFYWMTFIVCNSENDNYSDLQSFLYWIFVRNLDSNSFQKKFLTHLCPFIPPENIGQKGVSIHNSYCWWQYNRGRLFLKYFITANY